jgi:drug/metabolite transporter (DMT)-like permease
MWMLFVAGAVLSWGAYGAMLALGQSQLGNPLKALLCVGAAYFLIGVIVPVFALGSQGGLSNFNQTGLVNATIAGALGAIGAACIIWAFRTGGLPIYVMPIVFGGAPIVNVIVAMLIRPPQSSINPLMYAGFALVSIGAWMVLYFRPTA